MDRVTITLAEDVVRDIDRREKNRSKFGGEGVRRELDDRHRCELRRSLENPHPEAVGLAKLGIEEWSRSLPEADIEALVDFRTAKAVRWVPGEGWVEDQA